MPGVSPGPLRMPDWRALPPAQRNALAWRIARRAHAARARAIGEALRSVVGRLFGRPNAALVAARLPVSARHRR
jgi:hypothetical protein